MEKLEKFSTDSAYEDKVFKYMYVYLYKTTFGSMELYYP